MARLHVGDTIIVRSGSDKGKTGKVTAVHPSLNKITVDGINMVTRHYKPSAARPQGGVAKETRPIAISKVGLVHPTNKDKASRVGYVVKKTGKVRVYRQADNKEIK